MLGGQTVVNHSGYKSEETVRAYSGNIDFQYLGNNTEEGQSLYGNSGSEFEGPIINITNTVTEGWLDIDSNGIIQGGTDNKPVRVHSDKKFKQKEPVGLYSGSCFIFPKKEMDKLQAAFDRWGVQPGDIIGGYVKQPIPEP
jgi:hypothetical protein